jgi:hypothetical protein
MESAADIGALFPVVYHVFPESVWREPFRVRTAENGDDGSSKCCRNVSRTSVSADVQRGIAQNTAKLLEIRLTHEVQYRYCGLTLKLLCNPCIRPGPDNDGWKARVRPECAEQFRIPINAPALHAPAAMRWIVDGKRLIRVDSAIRQELAR